MVTGNANHAAGFSTRVRHDTFTISRQLDVSPADAFAAFADPAIRRRWSKMPGADATYHCDFQVGGGETARGMLSAPDSAPELLEYRSRYIDIVAPHRIVFAYEAVVDSVLRWASLVTVELHAESAGTHLGWTEQVAFLAYTGDGSAERAHLRGGAGLRLNGLEAALQPSDGPAQGSHIHLRRR